MRKTVATITLLLTLLFGRARGAEAKGKVFPAADGFTPPDQSRPANKDSGLFNQSKSQNKNTGSDKPRGNGSNGGDDNNSNFEPECIENSKLDNLYNYWHEPMYQSDSETIDTETESDWSEDSD